MNLLVNRSSINFYKLSEASERLFWFEHTCKNCWSSYPFSILTFLKIRTSKALASFGEIRGSIKTNKFTMFTNYWVVIKLSSAYLRSSSCTIGSRTLVCFWDTQILSKLAIYSYVNFYLCARQQLIKSSSFTPISSQLVSNASKLSGAS